MPKWYSVGSGDIGLRTPIFRLFTLTINGINHSVLVSNDRIGNIDLGVNDFKLHVYETRGRDDNPEVIATLEKKVIVNYCCSVISLDDLFADIEDRKDQYFCISQENFHQLGKNYCILDYLSVVLDKDVFESYLNSR